MPRYGHAVLGGTFDRFHVGHAALLARAFHVGRDVSVGVTTDGFLSEHPKPLPERIQPYARRRAGVVRWIRAHYPGRTYRVVPLANRFGRSVEPGVDVLVVSADTWAGGRAVNAERRRRGRAAVPIEIVPVVLADDLAPVSSRRIRAGEIDRRGRRRAPLSVGWAVTDPRDADVVVRAIRRALPAARPARAPPRNSRRGALASADPRALARRVLRTHALGFVVARRRSAEWDVVELAEGIQLGPRRVRARGPGALERALVGVLRPSARLRE